MTYSTFCSALEHDLSSPPDTLSDPQRVLWLIRADQWEAAHDLASAIDTPTGSRLHGLLHTIEGDLGNAAYWYARANAPAISAEQIETEWETLARDLCENDS